MYFNVWPTTSKLLLFIKCYRELAILQMLRFRDADCQLGGRRSEDFVSMVSARGEGVPKWAFLASADI